MDCISTLHVEYGGGAEGGGGGGTAWRHGAIVNAHQHILEKHTSAGILDWTNASDTDGVPHNLIGDQLSAADIIPFRGKNVHVAEEIFAGLRSRRGTM